MEKIIQMMESADEETVILGCILFLRNHKPREFPGDESINPTIYKHKITNLSSTERTLIIVDIKEDTAIILYYGVLHLTINFQKTNNEYSAIFNEINTIKI